MLQVGSFLKRVFVREQVSESDLHLENKDVDASMDVASKGNPHTSNISLFN